jgi:hypothetical protein
VVNDIAKGLMSLKGVDIIPRSTVGLGGAEDGQAHLPNA